MRRTDTLILGGGPAGSAAAIALARAGARPLLIEREREGYDALCGGFVSWRTLRTLAELGLPREALGGHTIDRLTLFSERGWGEAPLPQPAIGLSRLRLDAMLRARAEAAGAAVERGVAARLAEPGRVALADGGEVACEGLFLATGKHECRGLARPHMTGDPTLGLRLRLRASRPLSTLVGSAIELHLFRGGYAGLLLQENGSGNLCMAVQKSRLTEAGGKPRALLASLARESCFLAERLAHAELTAPIDAIAAIPYGWRATQGEAGLFRLGDQAAVIPSLAGEGIGIALASGVMAAEHYLAGGASAAPAFQAELARRTRIPVLLGERLRDLAAIRAGRRVAPHLLRHFPALGAAMARLTRIAP